MKTTDWLREQLGPLDPAPDIDAPDAADRKVRRALAEARSLPHTPRRLRPALQALGATAAASAVAVGVLFGYRQLSGGTEDGPRIVSPQASVAYPMESARDWVSYGDYVAVIHVKDGSEKAGSLPADARNRGEGLISRSGRIVIDKLLNRREGAEKLPPSFTTSLAGYWWDKDTGRQEFGYTGLPRIEPGHHYIAVLVWDEDLDGFGIVNHGGTLPYDRHTIGLGERAGTMHTQPLPDGQLTGLAEQVNGERLADIQRILQRTKPYPAAAAHPELSPAQRFQKVQQAQAQR